MCFQAQGITLFSRQILRPLRQKDGLSEGLKCGNKSTTQAEFLNPTYLCLHSGFSSTCADTLNSMVRALGDAECLGELGEISAAANLLPVSITRQ